MKTLTEDQIEEIYSKGDALVMESERCVAQYLYKGELKKIVKKAEVKLDFVFLTACHQAEAAAGIFLEAGAQHVIVVSKLAND